MAGRLPLKPSNNQGIVAAIEKDRPVRPGHHVSHQTEAILKWLRQKEQQKSKE